MLNSARFQKVVPILLLQEALQLEFRFCAFILDKWVSDRDNNRVGKNTLILSVLQECDTITKKPKYIYCIGTFLNEFLFTRMYHITCTPHLTPMIYNSYLEFREIQPKQVIHFLSTLIITLITKHDLNVPKQTFVLRNRINMLQEPFQVFPAFYHKRVHALLVFI